jgi:hypothetical protein
MISQRISILVTTLIWMTAAGITAALAQQSLSPDAFQSSLTKINDAAKKLKALALEKVQFDEDSKKLAQRIKDHNAQAAPDISTAEGQSYHSEMLELKKDQDAMNNRAAALSAQLRTAQSTINIQMGILRIATFLGCLKAFEAEVHACAQMADLTAAAGCLNEVWERHC